jgi:RNA polymerase sigma-70 factor (ECF subfamily)
MGNDALDAAMDRYADGDADAFAPLYDGLAPQLRRFVARHAVGQAEDLVQQTFFQMHLARGTFLRGAPVRPWAFAIARRLLIDQIRQVRRNRRRHEIAAASEASNWDSGGARPDDDYVALETAREIEALIDGLPEAQRRALELTRGHGLSMREAAERLGTTVTAVKLSASRALRRLRAVLGRAARQGAP